MAMLFGFTAISASAQTGEPPIVTHMTSSVPLFEVSHPNVVAPLSDLLPLAACCNPTRYRTGTPWYVAGNGRELVSENGDRLLILRPDDPDLRRDGRAEAQPMLIAQITDQDTGLSTYLFFSPYIPSRPPETADERELLGGLTWIALYRLDRRSGMTVADISTGSLANLSGALTDNVLGMFVGDGRFAWADPHRRLSDGRYLIEAIPDANLRADAEAADRAANREEFNLVFRAMNRYWVEDCNVASVLRQVVDTGTVFTLLGQSYRADNGACRVDGPTLTAWFSVESVDRSRCDFAAASGTCHTTMVLGCRTHIGIGQEIDAICPYFRVPQPVQITHETRDGELRILNIRSLAD